jgi:putative ABC transport system permease protein
MAYARSRAWYRTLLRLLPADVRAADGAALEDAAIACLAREHNRAGAPGFLAAWVRLTLDLLTTTWAMRRSRARGHADDLRLVPDFDSRPGQGTLERHMDNLRKDLRYAVRSLRRQPGFTIVTILTLALGIGANTAVFSVVNSVLLRPLPYPQSERLEYISSRFPTLGFDQFWISIPEYVDFKTHNRSFVSLGGYSVQAANLDTTPPSRPVAGLVTPDLMPTLGVPPLHGRWFTDEDSVPNAPPTAILSWELWQRAYGGDASIVTRNVQLNNVSTQIIGIMPRGYDVHDSKIEVWVPLTINPQNFPNSRGSHFLYLVGRLKDDVTRGQALADIDRLLKIWNVEIAPKAHAPSIPNHTLRLDPLQEDIVGNIRQALMILQAAVGFVLLIACANLANLLIARADSRTREYAVRAALGATRGRLFRQLLTEGLVLTSLAAVVGVALAYAGLSALVAINPDGIPRAAEIRVDTTVLAFTLGIAVLTGLIFALVPLVHLGSMRASEVVRESGTRTTVGKARVLARAGLVVAEVALAVLLVVGAGLLIRSFLNLMRSDMGFDRSQLTTFSLVLPAPKYNVTQRLTVYGELLEKLRALPGVQSVAAMSGLPPLRNVNANDTDFEHIPDNLPPGEGIPQNTDYWQFVTLGYTDTMGIPVLQGRAFTEADRNGEPVVLVNEALVRRFFKDRDPLGGRLKAGFGEARPWMRIVGVLKDVKQCGVAEDVGTEVYMLADQMVKIPASGLGNMNFVVRSTRPLDSLAGEYRRIVQEADATLPLIRLRSMDDVVTDAVAEPRFLTTLLAVFAGLALLLAAVGTYGILSYLVAERKQEIGIRMALGADRSGILGLIMSRGLILCAIGLVIGLAASLLLTRVLASLLFNVTPTDPLTLAVVSGVMIFVAAAACFIPAWRATKVDPLTVLRDA